MFEYMVGCSTGTSAAQPANAKSPKMAIIARVIDSPTRAFSSEVDTGSREENASKQKIRAQF
jgi:hypothetical protein